jgi:CRISPR-associated exonuclease Cas4
MKKDINITGSMIQAYVICPRQAWLMSRQLTGDQRNDFIEIGRLLAEETYSRDKKEILIPGIGKVDMIRETGDSITLIETKKSSKMMDAAKMQLLFYMYHFRKKTDQKLRAEIRVPKEKKVIELELTEESSHEIERIIDLLENILEDNIPPEPAKRKYCKTCSFLEFCWS